jgi:hypothetical protein
MRKVELYDYKGLRAGRFEINGYPFGQLKDAVYTIQPNSMGIYVEHVYQGRNMTRVLISKLIEKIYEMEPTIQKNQLFFIDTDASLGFWDYIGMRDVPEPSRFSEGYGYEKYITLENLQRFAYSDYE